MLRWCIRMNWQAIFNRLWRVINVLNTPSYFGGPRFVDAVREVNPDLPGYEALMEIRKEQRRSTTRKDYFLEVLMDLDEPRRVRAVNVMLNQLERDAPEAVAEIRGLLNGAAAVPMAAIPPDLWNADRLERYLGEIDAEIAASNYERALTLSYTCLEGFFKAFARAKQPDKQPDDEIMKLARWVRTWLAKANPGYPEEVWSLIGSIAGAVDRARNRFSEAHFDGDAARWLAVNVRDSVNSEIRLLLHFL
jgi:hypothetical protein